MTSDKPKILIVAPLVDVPTVTSNLAIFELLDYASTKDNIDIDILWGAMANRVLFDIKNAMKNYSGIIYYGHGKETKLHGTHLFWSVISVNNVKRLKGKAISTMACLSAKVLGKVAIEDGVSAYIGTDEVYYAAFPEKERNYLNDWIDYTISKDKALLDGKTFGEAYEIFEKKASQYLNIYKQNIHYRNYDWYYEATLHNLQHTKLIGDKNVRLFEKLF